MYQYQCQSKSEIGNKEGVKTPKEKEFYETLEDNQSAETCDWNNTNILVETQMDGKEFDALIKNTKTI